MELFTKKIGPVFLKENSDAEAYIEKLNSTQIAKMQNLLLHRTFVQLSWLLSALKGVL